MSPQCQLTQIKINYTREGRCGFGGGTLPFVYIYAMKQLPWVIFEEKGYGSFGSVLEGRNWSAGSEYRYDFYGKNK